MTGSADEGSVAYGHIARTIELPSDRMWIGFDIRPEAKFSDGSPVTAEDVVWSFRTLLDHGRPSYKLQFADVAEAVAEGPRRVVFRFKNNTNRDLPMIVGGIPVMSKKFFEGRDFKAPLTVPPIAETLLVDVSGITPIAVLNASCICPEI